MFLGKTVARIHLHDDGLLDLSCIVRDPSDCVALPKRMAIERWREVGSGHMVLHVAYVQSTLFESQLVRIPAAASSRRTKQQWCSHDTMCMGSELRRPKMVC